MKYRVFEGFAGIGSYSIGLKECGIDYEIVGISEIDKDAIKAYQNIHKLNHDYNKEATIEEMVEDLQNKGIGINFTSMKGNVSKNKKEAEILYHASNKCNNYGDITKIEPSNLPDFDVFIYSAPCKSISLLGKRQGMDKEDDGEDSNNFGTSLLWHTEKIIKYKKPKYLVMENVKQLVGKTNLPNFKEYLKILDNLGYNNYYDVLDAQYFDLPQHRERVLLVSIRKDVDDGTFVMPTNENKTLLRIKDIIEPVVDDKYYLSKDKIYRISHWNGFQKAFGKVRGMNSIAPTITARGAGEEHNGMIIFSEHLDGDVNLHEVAQEVYNNDAFEKYKFRKLTPLESWRLQGYSDEYFYLAQEAGLSERRLYERPGRGVPITIVKAIFNNLLKGE